MFIYIYVCVCVVCVCVYFWCIVTADNLVTLQRGTLLVHYVAGQRRWRMHSLLHPVSDSKGQHLQLSNVISQVNAANYPAKRASIRDFYTKNAALQSFLLDINSKPHFV